VNKLKYKHIKLFGWMPVFNLACSLCFGIYLHECFIKM